MKSISSLVLTTSIAASGLLSSATGQNTQTSDVTTAGVGRSAPPLSSLDASYHRRTLSDFRGRRAVLLTFFPKCFTGNCASQLTSLRDSYPAFQKAGVEVWAVSTDPADGPQGQRAFSKHLKLPFPLLPDTNRKISLAYGAVQSKEQMAARMSVLIDKEGKVRWIDKQISPRTHGPDVLAKMEELGMLPAPVAKQ